MSDEEVDLNAMIQNDRKRQYEQRTKKRQQHRRQRRDFRDSNRDYDRRDRSRDDRRDDRRDRSDNRRERRRDNPRTKQELVIQSYAISATGFVSDVSLDDILKLAKGKKIINIKAFFEREDGQPIEPGKDNAMSVIINFVSKQDADEFVKEYSDKKLDGKNPLVFQFRRGIVNRRPRKAEKAESDSESDGKEGEAKSEERQNQRRN